MIVLQIENVKEFMERLFGKDMFDRFHVRECEVTTFTTFYTDGRRQDDWYDTDEKVEDSTGLVTWKQLKPFVYEWIKGRKIPHKMKLDFCHYMVNGDVGSMRIQFESGQLHLFTGYMQKAFTIDRAWQQQWDDSCIQFIKKNDIVSTQLE